MGVEQSEGAKKVSKDISEAVKLLRDENLVWSSDMEDIKLELATLLEVSAGSEMVRFVADGVAKRIIYDGGTKYDLGLETR